jgi:hypothetical protein
MDMHSFEVGSGLSVHWVHWTLLAVVGAIVALGGLLCVVSFVFKLNDGKSKLGVSLIFKICGVLFIIALILGVISSM